MVCPKCGITGKSGKLSCCGRGGSWFGNCGSAGEAKLDHKWSEGVEACKAWSQSKIVVGQQVDGAGDESKHSFHDVVEVNSNASVIMRPDTLMFTTGSVSTPMLGKTSVTTSATKSVNTAIATVADANDTSMEVLITAAAPTSAGVSITTQRYGGFWSTVLHMTVFVMATSER